VISNQNSGEYVKAVSTCATPSSTAKAINERFVAEKTKNETANIALAKIMKTSIWRNLHELPVSRKCIPK
jgi:hypothetical protein